MYIVLNFESSYLNLKSCFEVFSLGHGVQDSRTTNFIHQNEGLSPVQLLLVLTTSLSAAPTTSHSPSQSFHSSPTMESYAVVSSESLILPEPPDPDLDMVFPMDSPVPLVPLALLRFSASNSCPILGGARRLWI